MRPVFCSSPWVWSEEDKKLRSIFSDFLSDFWEKKTNPSHFTRQPFWSAERQNDMKNVQLNMQRTVQGRGPYETFNTIVWEKQMFKTATKH